MLATIAQRRRLLALLLLPLLLPLLAGCSGPFSRGALKLELTTDPNPPGITATTFIVQLRDDQGAAVDGASVSIVAVAADGGQQGPSATLTAQGNGRYSATGTFPAIGSWKVTVTATSAGYDSATREFIIVALHPVPPQ